MTIKPLIPLITTLILMLTIGSCKKSDVNKAVALNGTFQAVNTINLSDVFMYTASGRVTNQDSVKAYLARHDNYNSGSFLFAATSPIVTNGPLQVDFTTGGNAQLSKDLTGSIGGSTYNIIQKTSAGFVLVAADTALITEDAHPSHISILMTDAGSLNQVSNCQLIPNGAGFEQLCTYHSTFQFLITDGQVYLTLFDCAVSTGSNGYYASSYVSNYRGLFNNSVISELKAGDTLVYQAKNILFSKKE